ncbi:type IV secretory system conjugative DNA transfer family protein [Salsipaludibacter albus]|uniref:type IV secretory system conjugative DNA transfer family protein n=1 Tax=Salsipaludibacter albus TaxID=2849650 RepID=UPI001EE43A8B|nr:type IV secretory system conjugative DNA transfer family protein [Salsipaludibacter albus]
MSAKVWLGESPQLGLVDTVPVLLALVDSPGDPAAAFPSETAVLVPGPVPFWTTLALLLLVPLAVAIVFLQWRIRRRPPEVDTSARWATTKDLKPLIVKRPTPGRLTLGTAHGRLLAAEPGHSLIVMGPTQSGKTSGLAIPAILEWDGPVLATSVKTDLLDDTITTRLDRGDVWIYDPTDTVADFPSATWSALAESTTWQGALRTATWLTDAARDGGFHDADFWYANAAKLLAPMLYAAATSGRTMTDVVRWVDVQEQPEVDLELEVAGNPDAIAAFAASTGREDRARSSVYTTAETILRAFADPAVARSSTTSEIDPARLLDGGSHTLYVSAPIHEQARLRPLFTALIQSVLTAAYDRAAGRSRLDPPLLVVLDEAANIAPLPDLAQLASTAAGLGIQLVTVWQDRAQIAHRYGASAATVVNNHRAKLVLGGVADTATTGDVAQLVGETDVARHSTSTDADGRVTATEATQTQLLASASMIRTMRPFEGLLVYGSLPPARLRLRPWFEGR